MNLLLPCWVALATSAFALASLTSCPPRKDADFDFIVVGGGAGGGPLAARLAESGYSGGYFNTLIRASLIDHS